jgi:hypothetical protein
MLICCRHKCFYRPTVDADIRLDDHTRPDAGIHLLYTIKNWSSVLFVYINKIPVLSILLQRYSITRFFNSDFFIKYLRLGHDSHPKIFSPMAANSPKYSPTSPFENTTESWLRDVVDTAKSMKTTLRQLWKLVEGSKFPDRNNQTES